MQQESIQAALALLLGPQTEYRTRLRATRRLVKQGPAILPLVLSTFSNYPEITKPAWPWWPPQYEHTSRLLLHLSQKVQIPLADLLHHPILSDTPGPVLWTNVMEAASQIPEVDNEELLCQGLTTHWTSVRYAAAMALATRARTVKLHPSTRNQLYEHQQEHETFPVRLTASYALLNSGDPAGIEMLAHFLHIETPQEVRKAATFILATELPVELTTEQQEYLNLQLVPLLSDFDTDIAQHAAHALSKIATAHTLTILYPLLEMSNEHVQITILTLLEEIAQQHKVLRHQMRQHTLSRHLLPLLKSVHPTLRRQAFYTLAACGGEYVAAVLGTIVMNKDHPGQMEAVECLRFFHGALRAPLRGHIVRWLLRILTIQNEELQITALDSLAQLLWQAQHNGREQAWQEIRHEVTTDKNMFKLFHASSPVLRQRSLELLAILGDFLITTPDLQSYCHNLLLSDSDSGVRACVAYVCGRTAARWAMTTLLQALLDPDEHVAYTALHALTEIATVEDSIVVYALAELSRLYEDEQKTTGNLGREARNILKQWQKADAEKAYKMLHCLD
ncbi:hypothetical protein KDW_03800 [Dictyobacter vulcani]|uniref:HEAT repeat-containing PBS lyase n=1 Tax=Dictyobacter vulcani TaxID=2607529 RepID=A0A5J4KC06_9CHLR|nr:hypothetical protein [Dictyobacter vulcani]GER86218.1 hypothetical protein KDW_03800 [Dictyobacter vulcani]